MPLSRSLSCQQAETAYPKRRISAVSVTDASHQRYMTADALLQMPCCRCRCPVAGVLLPDLPHDTRRTSSQHRTLLPADRDPAKTTLLSVYLFTYCKPKQSWSEKLQQSNWLSLFSIVTFVFIVLSVVFCRIVFRRLSVTVPYRLFSVLSKRRSSKMYDHSGICLQIQCRPVNVIRTIFPVSDTIVPKSE